MSSEGPENAQSFALRRSEEYLAETQRLTRTGSFAIDVARQALTYSSAEHSRLYGFDPAQGLPSMDEFFERIHPDDRTRCMEAMSEGIRERTDTEVEFRVLIPGCPPRILRAIGHPLPGASGESVEIVGTVIDVTERRAAEAELARIAEAQAALRRVATLVAKEAPPMDVFAKVAEEAAHTLGDVDISLWRDEDDGIATTVAAFGNVMAPGTRLPTDGGISCPIPVGGRVWGVLAAARTGRQPLAEGAEAQLRQFAELVATAIANAQARSEVERLADEQAALRRVAVLVAQGIGAEPVFQAVAAEARALLDCDIAAIVRFEADGTVTLMGAHNTFQPQGVRLEPDPGYVIAAVRATGRAARFDTDDPTAPGMPKAVRAEGIRAALASPIVVDGELWGTITAGTTKDGALPPEAEARLAQFAELMAMAVADTEARARADRLTEEQAALSRVATLVAKEAPPAEVFRQVAEEVARALGDVDTSLWRDEGDGTATIVAVSGRLAEVGTRMPTDGDGVIATVLREGRPCWTPDNRDAVGAIVEAGRELGISSAIGCPIVVGDRVWGALGAARVTRERFALGIERQLAQFAELVATAIANAQARGEVERLADDQTALRRVATLVARGVEPPDLFAAVTREVGRMFGTSLAAVGRWDPDGPALVILGLITPMAGLDVGSRQPLDETTVAAAVYRTGRSARTDAPSPFSAAAREMKAVSGVSAPIVVEGRPWGAITVASREPLPRDAEQRLEKFTELVATAVANAESRDALRKVVEEQAALRRVATLVARGASPAAVFGAVATEMAALLRADGGLTMCRYEPDGELTIVAHRGAQEPQLKPGTRIRHDDPHSVTSTVRRTGLPARIDTYADTHGSIGQVIERLRFRAGVGVPILVDGRVWGVTVANWMGGQPPPADTEQRMAQFGELLDTAIANADGRDQLNASRARLLTTADDVRRRVVRDLHDGAQQRLVHGIISLKRARSALTEEPGELRSLVEEALEQVERGNDELRELAHGILPAILSRNGLRAATRALVARLDFMVRVDIPDERFPAEVEASAYFTVAEALTNVLKHAEATHAEVTASTTAAALRIEVRDDGIGGADPDGAGLIGLQDRTAALGGWLSIESPVDGGTVLAATLPLAPG